MKLDIKLFDSELKVMECLWDHGDTTAAEIAKQLKESIGWNKNTTYTVIKKCIQKGTIERLEPNFFCKALITKEQAKHQETVQFIDKFFEGKIDMFLSSFVSREQLTPEEVERLYKIVEKLK